MSTTEDYYWFLFFRNKSKWVCLNNSDLENYFTYGKTYDVDYIDYENKDVYLILDNGKDDRPISFKHLIDNFITLEDFRDQKLRTIGL